MKPHPIVSGMAPHLKDPKNYQKIRKVILNSLATKHSHSDISGWAGCSSCQMKFAGKSKLLKDLGFKSVAEYMVWQRIHTTIDQRVKLR